MKFAAKENFKSMDQLVDTVPYEVYATHSLPSGSISKLELLQICSQYVFIISLVKHQKQIKTTLLGARCFTIRINRQCRKHPVIIVDSQRNLPPSVRLRFFHQGLNRQLRTCRFVINAVFGSVPRNGFG